MSKNFSQEDFDGMLNYIDGLLDQYGDSEKYLLDLEEVVEAWNCLAEDMMDDPRGPRGKKAVK